MGLSIELPKDWDPVRDFETFLKTLFDPSDKIRTVTIASDVYKDKKDGKWKPKRGIYKRTVGSYRSSLSKSPGDIANTVGDWNPEAGGWIGINALDGTGVAKKNVVSFNFTLVESDTLSPEEQIEVFQELNLPIATLVFSGGRSVHAVVHVDASDLKQYDERVNFLHEVLRLNGVDMDKGVKDPSRLSRLPGITRDGKEQFLIATNVGADSWDTWFDSVRNDYQELADKVKITPITTISAQELMEANLPPVEWIIPELLPRSGLAMEVGPSKIGKSWMVLDMGLAVAAGRPFMDFQTNQCGVMYAALEDSLVRLQDRMNKVLWGRDAPEDFDFATDAPSIQNGLTSALNEYLLRKPKCKLIIIDTLQKVRGGAKNGESVYAADYREMTALKKFADSHNVAVLVVHHTRKMKDSDDVFNMISGTTGLMGCADTIMMLTKEQRSGGTAHFNLTGRDVLQRDLVLEFNKTACSWRNLGDQEAYQEEKAKEDYENSPMVLTIKSLLKKDPNHEWKGTASKLLEAGLYVTQTRIAPNTKKVGPMLKELDQLLLENDGILHSVGKHGNSGVNHYFWYAKQEEKSDEK